MADVVALDAARAVVRVREVRKRAAGGVESVDVDLEASAGGQTISARLTLGRDRPLALVAGIRDVLLQVALRP